MHRRQGGLVTRLWVNAPLFSRDEQVLFNPSNMNQPKETILAKTYDLLKEATPRLNALPRNYKYNFSDRVLNHLADLLELLIEAVYAPPEPKKQILRTVNLKLEKLRFFFRLGFELGLYKSTLYEDMIRKIDEIGKMTGGWLKSLN
jgi:hypothetical protein